MKVIARSIRQALHCRFCTFTSRTAQPHSIIGQQYGMTDTSATHESPTRADPVPVERIREKFFDTFGLALTLPDDAIRKRFSLTSEGDLVMILR